MRETCQPEGRVPVRQQQATGAASLQLYAQRSPASWASSSVPGQLAHFLCSQRCVCRGLCVRAGSTPHTASGSRGGGWGDVAHLTGRGVPPRHHARVTLGMQLEGVAVPQVHHNIHKFQLVKKQAQVRRRPSACSVTHLLRFCGVVQLKACLCAGVRAGVFPRSRLQKLLTAV